MVIRNETRYPTDEVRKLVKFGLGRIDAKDVLILVKHTRNPRSRYSGLAEYHPPRRELPKSCIYRITLRLGQPVAFATTGATWKRHWDAGAQFPEMSADTWQEALVSITAHEIKHIDQARERERQGHAYDRRGRRRHTRGARASEVACEHYAKFMVEQYQESLKGGR